jgi:heme exporter protein B
MLSYLLLFELKHYIKNIYQFIYIYGFYVLLLVIFSLVSPSAENAALAAKTLPWIAISLGALLLGAQQIEGDLASGYIAQLRLSRLPLEGYITVKIMLTTILGALPVLGLIPLLEAQMTMPPTLEAASSALNALYWVLPIAALASICVITLAATLIAGIPKAGLILQLISLPWLIPIILLGSDAANATSTSASPAFWLLIGLTGLLLPLSILLSAQALRE